MQMKTVNHPYLEGVKCREDGAVWVPGGKTGRRSHWTFGALEKKGYLYVCVSRKHYKVHRLICEAFHGVCPPDKTEVDHIDRNPSNNKPENLRWCSRSENNRNTGVHEASVAKYGVSGADDRNAYQRSRYSNNPEERERRKARSHAYYAKKKVNKEANK